MYLPHLKHHLAHKHTKERKKERETERRQSLLLDSTIYIEDIYLRSCLKVVCAGIYFDLKN